MYTPDQIAEGIQQGIKQAKEDPENPTALIMMGASVIAAFLNIAIDLKRIADGLTEKEE